MRTVLIEASPWNPATGAVVSTALAGGGVKAYTHRTRNDWLAGVTAEPKFSAKVEFDESGFGGGARPEYGVLEWTPGDPTKLKAVANLLWDGADIEVRVGDDELPVPVWTILLIGVVEAQACRGGKLSLKVRDKSAELDVSVAQDRFAGSGGIEGDAFVAERLKRRAFGACNNVEALPLKAATNIYEVADPAFPLTSIDDVKDIGRSASNLTTVAWQGSIAATLAALEAATPPSGGGTIAPSIACVKWWTQPVGPLTADIVGTLGTGASATPARLAELIVAARSTLTVSNAAAAAGWRNATAGLFVDSESETIAQALDRLLKGVSLAWNALADGTIELREIKLTGPVETLSVIDAARTRSFKPLKRRRVGFLRNHRIHTEAEIASALRDDAGAVLTAGADWSTNVTSRPANLAALVGSEGVNNAGVSISSGGALAGAGGGQVTIGGLGFLGDLYATGGDNIAANPTFDTSAKWTLGDGADHVGAAAYANTPGKGAARIGPGITGYAAANSNTPVPFNGNKLYLSAFLRSTGSSVAVGTLGANCYDGAGNFITGVGNAVAVSATGQWELLKTVVDIPAGTALVVPYWSAANATGGDFFTMTAFRASPTENAADVTSYIDGPAELIVQASSAGVPLTGQLPKAQAFKLWRNGVDVTALAAWSITPLSGIMTETVGAATGVAELDLDGGVFTSGRFRLSAVYQGLTRTKDVVVTRADAEPPSTGGGGGGGSGASGSISGTVNSTTPVVISDELIADTGSGGQVALSATYGFSSSGVPAKHLMTRWQREIASVWTDVGSAKQSDIGAYTTGAPEFDSGEGQGTHSETIGSLGANTTGHKFRLTGYTPSGTVARFPYGDVGATGS
jgi:hypothetical protein